AFRVTGRDTHVHRGSRSAGDRAATGQQLLGLTEFGEPHVVRIVLTPLETTLFTIDAQLQAVFATRSHLAGPEHTLRTPFEAEHDVYVIIKLAAGDKCSQVRSNCFGF